MALPNAGDDLPKDILQELSAIEKDFAEAELQQLRQRELDFRPLYARRQDLLSRMPNFWSTVFQRVPESVEQFLQPSDLAILAALTNFSVDRFELSNEANEPRSLRFNFEFGKNEWFEDAKLVKEFRYREYGQARRVGLTSSPVSIKWKNKRKDPTKGALDLACDLHNAEKAMKVKNIDTVAREGLWQYEKLRTKLASLEEESDHEPSFFNWFGFRGIQPPQEQNNKKDPANGVEDEEEPEVEDDGLLDVEIFPPGEELSNAFADDMWPDLLEHFVTANFGDASDSEDGLSGDVEHDAADGDEAPDLLVSERPSKKQRVS